MVIEPSTNRESILHGGRFPDRLVGLRRRSGQREAVMGTDIDVNPVPAPVVPLAAQHLRDVGVSESLPQTEVL